MGMELKKTLVAAEHRAQYDECVKKLLSHKEILAHILVHTVDEFKGMSPKDSIRRKAKSKKVWHDLSLFSMCGCEMEYHRL